MNQVLKTWIAAIGLLGAVLLLAGGCANRPAAVGRAETVQTGRRVVQGPARAELRGELIEPNVEFRGDTARVLSVEGTGAVSQRQFKYDTLLAPPLDFQPPPAMGKGPRPQTVKGGRAPQATFASAFLTNGEAAMGVYAGWMLMRGRHPLAVAPWGTVNAEGCTVVIEQYGQFARVYLLDGQGGAGPRKARIWLNQPDIRNTPVAQQPRPDIELDGSAWNDSFIALELAPTGLWRPYETLGVPAQVAEVPAPPQPGPDGRYERPEVTFDALGASMFVAWVRQRVADAGLPADPTDASP
ncbi:MAG: hypothetical protein IBJ11_09935 [Phycisphaerales bacterium]|nr:hypothetical protein [Phycisphaerales bacterium]